MPSGGARPGAGRKKKSELYARPIARAEKQIVDRLPDLVENLLRLADGGYERVKEKYLPAGLVFRDEVTADDKGHTFTTKVPAFPNTPEDELVLVERVREFADGDRKANEYLLDRIMGRPTVELEGGFEMTHNLPPALDAMIAKVYGTDAE